jgi:ABC-type multidrug transport system fused ATPase/permease subunit
MFSSIVLERGEGADCCSVDEATERKIHDLTVEMLKEKTVVSVLHRLETAVKYDKILVLDEGKVLDFGTPSEVIQRCELFSAFRSNENGEVGDAINTLE